MTPHRRRRVVKAAVVTCLVSLAGIAEASAELAFAWRLSRCDNERIADDHACGGLDDIAVDIGGIHLRNPWIERNGMTARAADVHITADDTGLLVRVAGLDATVQRAPSDSPVTTTRSEPASRTSQDPPAKPPLHRRLPWSIETDGHMKLALEHGVNVELRAARLGFRPTLGFDATFEVVASHPRATLASHGPLVAHKAIGGPWELQGTAAFADGAPLRLHLRGNTRAADLRLTASDGGTADLHVQRTQGGVRITGSAHEFALAPLQPLQPVLPVSMELGQAQVGGTFDLTTAGNELTADLETVSVNGIVVDDRRLSRAPLRFAQIGLDGMLEWNNDTLGAQLSLRHDRALAHVSVTRSAGHTQLSAQLDPIACQDLLTSVPDGLVDTVHGMQLEGSMDASIELDMDAAEVEAALAAQSDTVEPLASPGKLIVEFPFLDRCRVVNDAPGIDLAALRGAYRHRFVDDSGRERDRLLTPGVAGFVPLTTVPHLLRAFTTMEDSKFWSHDGFDRDQMERALWHNLGAGRVERGASTITQQTARNLWLGIDRSLSRKLQEALLASRLEDGLTKYRILELYINIIELGPEAYGVGEASRYHFGRPPGELNLMESVHLAALAPGPRLYSKRFANGRVDEAWRTNLKKQIVRMYMRGLITQEQKRAALKQPLRLIDHTRSRPS